MKHITAVNNKVLDVDLTSDRIGEIDISHSDRERYLGGKGLAVKLLHDHIKQGVDPLSGDNSKLKATGFTFKYPTMEEGMKETLAWYKENGWFKS